MDVGKLQAVSRAVVMRLGAVQQNEVAAGGTACLAAIFDVKFTAMHIGQQHLGIALAVDAVALGAEVMPDPDRIVKQFLRLFGGREKIVVGAGQAAGFGTVHGTASFSGLLY